MKLLSEGLYAELLDTDVAVSVVIPGAVQTHITENSGVTMPGSGGAGGGMPTTSPQQAARIIVAGVERDRLHIFVGKDSRVMNLAIKVAPRQATRFVQKQMKGLVSEQPRELS